MTYFPKDERPDHGSLWIPILFLIIFVALGIGLWEYIFTPPA